MGPPAPPVTYAEDDFAVEFAPAPPLPEGTTTPERSDPDAPPPPLVVVVVLPPLPAALPVLVVVVVVVRGLLVEPEALNSASEGERGEDDQKCVVRV